MNIITGYTGEAHITSADDQALNYGRRPRALEILPVGNRFAASAVGVNTVRILDGVGYLRGVGFRTAAGSYDDVAIASCQAGQKRIDIIAAHYERSGSTDVERMRWKVFAGTATSGTPTDPTGFANEMPWAGGMESDAPAYRVTVNGTTSLTITPLFTITPSTKTLAEEIAKLAGTKVLVSESIKSVAIPTLAGNETSSHITDSVVLPSGTDFFDAVPVDAGWLQPLGFGFSNSQRYVVFQVINVSTRTISNGVLRYLVRYYKTL
jgi:hypothetical protein